DKNFNLKHCNKIQKSALLDSIFELSSMSKIKILGLDKFKGLENLDDKLVNFSMSNEFKKNRLRNCEKGYWIFRFKGSDCRCIGKIIDNVFYILCIDTQLKAYSHGK
ncbi:hypothetical protein, partial [Fructilactobacillus florum]